MGNDRDRAAPGVAVKSEMKMSRTLQRKTKDRFVMPVRSRHPASAVTLGEALQHMRANDPDFLKEEGIDPVALEIGVQIKQARLRAGLTQKQLAEQSGVQQGAISDIERGKGKDGPSYRTIKMLAEAIGADLALSPREADIEAPVQGSNLHKVGNGGALTLTDVLVGSGMFLAPVLKSILPELAMAKLAKKLRATILSKQDEDTTSAENSRSELWELEPHGEASVTVSEPSIVLVFGGPAVVSGKGMVSNRVVLASTKDAVQLANTGNTPVSVLAVPVNSRALRDAVEA